MTLTTEKRPRRSVSTQVILGLVFGLVVGICVGDMAAHLHEIGKAFILLLQMTVLPYITLSLVTGLGHLSYAEVKMLALKVGALLALLVGPGLYRDSPDALGLSGLAIRLLLQYLPHRAS